ncbi:helix-turn-helix transcriptional regulator [Rhizobium panacihumi]|uniref:helix-turn-helix transcriptional regulator n=1 Tax=Rhizobium panacihumi TaxID=2008450 RepID=UPI003D7B8D26
MKTKHSPSSAIAELDPEMLAIVEAFAAVIVRMKAQKDEISSLAEKVEKAERSQVKPDAARIQQKPADAQHSNDILSGPKLMRIADVAEYLSMSRGTIYRRVKEGTFPPPKKLGHSVRWMSTDITAWIDELSQT